MRFSKFLPGHLCVWLFIIVATSFTAEARDKMIDGKTADTAAKLANDREAAFSGDEAMPLEAFKSQWTAFANELNETFGGQTVKLKSFGNDVGIRKGFSHLIYMALRVQSGTELTPSAQDLIRQHPFLQELTVSGSCYTGGDPYPKKMKDLLIAFPEMIGALRAGLDGWDASYRKKFEQTFQDAG
ncbi:MAG: hypothetical protein O3B73_14255 [bacterium]|jgi:hypothetical protein|nr:hypothetical protein [bacterium]